MQIPGRSLVRVLIAVSLLALPACERLFDKGTKENIAAADKKAAAGDYRTAVDLYEGALDGTAKTAEVHYKLALLYDDKLKSPIDALHHMDRYIELAPNGPHVRDAKAYKKEGEARLLTKLSNGSPITQQDAVRLKNENQILREQLTALRAQRAMPAATLNAKGEPMQKPIPPGARTYTVQSGDTLAKISRKYYKTPARARDIQDANFNALSGTVKIKPGMVLIIP
ncbi:Peptidoglycan-binding LysM [Chthoniobacter flavus Ellin428]|uniref:Peptidoglycan-binding LysM n=1 Tax=Chthoniobacter flavus Ellin428 TaxID=497964 RepID=B4D3Y6_9BACT|nr:Peptidoglycan-binding LysM [Chthoniobacter flavus Ellin428]TCO93550.1 LysM domain-containing protein [Chthoniobacter flavus]